MFNKLATSQFLKTLDRIECGAINVTLPDGRRYGFAGGKTGPMADMTLNDWSVPMAVARTGDCGLAETYRDGLWTTPDLQNLITFGLRNERSMQRYMSGNMLSRSMANLSYLFRRNSLSGSRRNIQAHYDLGNDFYSLWLDPTMTYSSAIFSSPGENLAQAQNNKYDRIIDRLSSASGSVLEIGCGWGGFAERAVGRGDYAVKGITLSNEQQTYASGRLGCRANIALEDYRAQRGTFDNIVSIEMFEAVGEAYWPTYFGKMSELLKKDGRAVVQTITIENSLFDRYRQGSDFIRSFIFPGGMLPSPERFTEEAGKAGLRDCGRFDFGHDYATTMEHWLKAFDDNTDAVRQLGYDEGFIRLWRFYLATCISSFRSGRIGVMQMELQHA
ncbi:MAG: cyclopropane-fatty-acyl-phospholipid synthase family protein [Micavibrio sp.]|nr:cyclopropane-fatty-acyl-phospholipid synthase family protein [Micavibrio sp.]